MLRGCVLRELLVEVTARVALTAAAVVVEIAVTLRLHGLGWGRIPLALCGGWCSGLFIGTAGTLLDGQGLIPFAVLGRLDRAIVLQCEIVDKRSMESRRNW